MDVPFENSRFACAPAALLAAGGPQGCVSLVTFLARAKKVTRAKRKCRALRDAVPCLAFSCPCPALASPLTSRPREVRQADRVKPRRGGANDARRFRTAHGCAFRKFPDRLRTRRAFCGGRTVGVCFFGYFLCTSKESDPRQSAKALALAAHVAGPAVEPSMKGAKAFARCASHFSCVAKKSNQKKATLRSARRKKRGGCAGSAKIFGSSILLLRKRRTSLCAAPAGLYSPCLPDLTGRGGARARERRS
jgi:hypothetical protein